MQDEHGRIHKSVPLSPELLELLDENRQGERSRRESDLDAPLFSGFSDPEKLAETKAALIKAMEAAGMDSAFVYAFEKTGLIVSEENHHLLSERDLAEWEAAVEEYRNLNN
jgi:hypothetical protein